MGLEYELVQASQQIRAWRGESPTLSDEESVDLAEDLARRSWLDLAG